MASNVSSQATLKPLREFLGYVPYLEPILIAIGAFFLTVSFFGNFTIAFVFNGKNLRKTSYSILFTTLAVSDTIYLSVTCPRRVVQWVTVYQTDIVRNSPAIVCKIQKYLAYCTAMLSAWVLVIISIERCISVALPMKAKTICTRKNIRIALAVVAIPILAVNGHYPYGWCPFVVDSKYHQIEQYLETLDLVLSVAVPFTVSITSNIIIIVLMRRSRHEREVLGTGGFRHRKVKSIVSLLCY
ncbi:uncharacterized protein LOC141898336 [Tubulanus polymorphus]|uniref:uncharacterized protein LOC141898336 n=1 Tax=Tubulanus polymorphus TaxID=672921 RepID=UPI003DA3C901